MKRGMAYAGVMVFWMVPALFSGCGGGIIAGEDHPDGSVSDGGSCDRICCEPPATGRGYPSFQCKSAGAACTLSNDACQPLDAGDDASCVQVCCGPPPGGRGSPVFQCGPGGGSCALPNSACEPDAAPLDAASSDAPTSDASSGCSPACGSGQICVSTESIGWANSPVPDAHGNCPQGWVASLGQCAKPGPSSCKPFQDSCLLWNCGCAQPLCGLSTSSQCVSTSPGQVTCADYVE